MFYPRVGFGSNPYVSNINRMNFGANKPELTDDEKKILAESSIYRTHVPASFIVPHGEDHDISEERTLQLISSLEEKGYLEKDENDQYKVADKHHAEADQLLKNMD